MMLSWTRCMTRSFESLILIESLPNARKPKMPSQILLPSTISRISVLVTQTTCQILIIRSTSASLRTLMRGSAPVAQATPQTSRCLVSQMKISLLVFQKRPSLERSTSCKKRTTMNLSEATDTIARSRRTRSALEDRPSASRASCSSRSRSEQT